MRTWQLRVLLSVQQKPLPLLRLPLVPAPKAWEEVEGGLHATAMQSALQGVLPSLAWGAMMLAGGMPTLRSTPGGGGGGGQQQQPRSQCHYGWWRWGQPVSYGYEQGHGQLIGCCCCCCSAAAGRVAAADDLGDVGDSGGSGGGTFDKPSRRGRE